MKIEIKNRWTNAVLYGGEFDTVCSCLVSAVKAGADLTGANLTDANLTDADLRGANLTDANLRGADLTGADLTDANLTDANLRGADLTGADLMGADLRGANLTGANLTGANLMGANLRGAYLTGANLMGANLTDANLTDAYLTGANLRGANLTGANLAGADLRGAHLTGANLTGANLAGADLEPVRVDFLSAVLNLPNELEFLRDAIVSGKVDGSTYSGECACLAGTLAHAKGIKDYDGGEIKNGRIFKSDQSSPREQFFLAIEKGDTPETNGASALALKWTDEAIAMRDNIRDLGVKRGTQAEN